MVYMFRNHGLRHPTQSQFFPWSFSTKPVLRARVWPRLLCPLQIADKSVSALKVEVWFAAGMLHWQSFLPKHGRANGLPSAIRGSKRSQNCWLPAHRVRAFARDRTAAQRCLPGWIGNEGLLFEMWSSCVPRTSTDTSFLGLWVCSPWFLPPIRFYLWPVLESKWITLGFRWQ